MLRIIREHYISFRLQRSIRNKEKKAAAATTTTSTTRNAGKEAPGMIKVEEITKRSKQSQEYPNPFFGFS